MVDLAHPDAGHQLVVLSLARVEFHAAIRRRQRLGDIADDDANSILRGFNLHLASLFLAQPTNDGVLEEALSLLEKYVLRAYDAIQLAGCLAVRTTSANDEIWFATSDQDLVQPAQSEGLHVVDPTA
jgi:hypothetical protein